MVLTSCQKQEDVSEVTEPAKTYVLADLALSLPASTAPRTRMTTDVTQSNGIFRGIQRLSIIPFTKQGKITSTDMPSYYESDPIVSTSWTVPAESTSDERRGFVPHLRTGRGCYGWERCQWFADTKGGWTESDGRYHAGTYGGVTGKSDFRTGEDL